MSGYLFIFGNTPKLSRAELTVFFPSIKLTAENVAFVDGDLDASAWIDKLGGTVKIAKVISQCSALAPKYIASLLLKTNKRTFGISSYSKKFRVTSSFLHEVKNALPSARFVLPKEGGALASVVVAKQKLVELVVVEDGKGWFVGQTVAVFDFEEWNRRDYGRPEADPKGGMLPPKVARMAVNLVSPLTHSPINPSPILLDPFCGVGTILGEALLTGWKVIGGDQSKEAIEKTQKNLEWLSQGVSLRSKETPCKLFVSDATHISEKLPPQSVDAIVTEPFLGSQSVDPKKVKNIIKGLEKLYIGCLKDWKKVLKPDAKVVIALPEYSISGKIFFVKKVIDICETLGYTLLAGPIAYHRLQAIVRRKFCVFSKISNFKF